MVCTTIVYDKDGVLLDESTLDMTSGMLVLQEQRTIYHPPVQASPEKGHYKTVKKYASGAKDVAWVIDQPAVLAAAEYYEQVSTYVWHEYGEGERPAVISLQSLQQEVDALRKENAELSANNAALVEVILDMSEIIYA